MLRLVLVPTLLLVACRAALPPGIGRGISPPRTSRGSSSTRGNGSQSTSCSRPIRITRFTWRANGPRTRLARWSGRFCGRPPGPTGCAARSAPTSSPTSGRRSAGSSISRSGTTSTCRTSTRRTRPSSTPPRSVRKSWCPPTTPRASRGTSWPRWRGRRSGCVPATCPTPTARSR